MNYPKPIKIHKPITDEVKKAKKSKHHNEKVFYDGIWFDSKKEKNRYRDLRLMEKAGVIKDLQMQVSYELQPKYEINGRKVQDIYYNADFVYMERTKNKDIEGWEQVIEDVKPNEDEKGNRYKTDVYKLKKKMFEFKYGVEIKEV